MEYAPYGDLEECVKESIPEQEAQTIAFQLIEALTIMHRKNFTHRDLKPSVRSIKPACAKYAYKPARTFS
jgi:serine/threonine protein kinase